MTEQVCHICLLPGADRSLPRPRTGYPFWFHNKNACAAEAFIEVAQEAIAYGTERLQVAATLIAMRVEDEAHREVLLYGQPKPDAMGE